MKHSVHNFIQHVLRLCYDCYESVIDKIFPVPKIDQGLL